MKDKIHPNYIEDQKITCACGNVIIAGSTRKDLRTEICSACHPFYTGHQKLLDTAGRVDKFLAKVKKAQKIKEKKVEVVDEELEEILHHEPKEIPVEEAVQTTLDLDQEQEKPEAKPAKKTVKAAAKKAPAKKAAAKKPAAKKAK